MKFGYTWESSVQFYKFLHTLPTFWGGQKRGQSPRFCVFLSTSGCCLILTYHTYLPYLHIILTHHTKKTVWYLPTSRSHKILAGDFCRRTKQICTYLSIYVRYHGASQPALRHRPRCTIARGVIAGPRCQHPSIHALPNSAGWRAWTTIEYRRANLWRLVDRPLRANDGGPTIDAMAMGNMRGT